MKTINLKYDFDKTYYYNKMISTPTKIKCMYCENGKHIRVGDGKEVECPVCKGKCEIDTGSGSIKEEPRKCFLSKITIEETKDFENINYHFIDEYDKSIFGTIYDDIDKCINGQTKGVMGYTS
jgi:hypothetical protein